MYMQLCSTYVDKYIPIGIYIFLFCRSKNPAVESPLLSYFIIVIIILMDCMKLCINLWPQGLVAQFDCLLCGSHRETSSSSELLSRATERRTCLEIDCGFV